MDKVGMIYMVVFSNGKSYIGQTVNIKRRIERHKSDSKTIDTKFYRAIRKYGWNNLKWTILHKSVPKDKLNKMEKSAISKHDTYNKGYNSTIWR